ncbi:helix-turn-helix domain-containing protein [Dokdonia sp.]|uniref:helix-turn-helix domain-containing protein n=1 Tax=Dokdonia sp. TaxID=2024995 RepID=UPI003265895E
MMYLLRYRRRYIHILCILFITQTIVAQEEFVTPDSLKNKTYSYLFDKFRTNYTDTISSLIYLNASLEKAITEDNKANKSYILVQLAYYEADKDRKLDLIKRSIVESKDADTAYTILPHYTLGLYYYTHFEYEKALEEYLKVLNITRQIRYINHEFITQYHIAELKGAIGKHEEAEELYKKCLYYENSKEVKDSITFTDILVGLAESMRYTKKHDSASYYYNYAKEKGYKKNPYYINIATINQGINLYNIGNFKESKQLLHKGNNEIDLNYPSNQKYYILSQFYLGKIHQLSNQDIDKTRDYFHTVDSLSTNMILPETREAYEFLIADYKKQGDLKAQLNTLNKLIRFDSIISLRKIRTVNKLHSEYDTPQLLKSKEIIIKNLKDKTTVLTIRTIYLIIFILLLILLFILQHKKHRKHKKRFNTIISELDNQETKSILDHSISSTPKPLLDGIDETTITTILNKLDLFEGKKGFLQKDITLAVLAKKCTTNTKYLPRVISAYKDKSFVNYINNLRIDYILKELKDNTTLQKYTIKTISEEAGFNTSESFATAFKKKTGIRPSFYIRNLKKEEII